LIGSGLGLGVLAFFNWLALRFSDAFVVAFWVDFDNDEVSILGVLVAL
jgi:hypothetical protein